MLIGLCGTKGNGKRAVVDYMERHGYISRGIMDPLKSACMDIFDLTYDQTDGQMKSGIDARWNTTPRRILQIMGDKIGEISKELGSESVLVDRFYMWYRTQDGPVVVHDIRKAHEAEMIHRLNGVMVRIIREGTLIVDDHVTERIDFESDYTLRHNGSSQDISDRVDEMLSHLQR